MKCSFMGWYYRVQEYERTRRYRTWESICTNSRDISINQQNNRLWIPADFRWWADSATESIPMLECIAGILHRRPHWLTIVDYEEQHASSGSMCSSSSGVPHSRTINFFQMDKVVNVGDGLIGPISPINKVELLNVIKTVRNTSYFNSYNLIELFSVSYRTLLKQ